MKARKAGKALEINGVAAAAELRRIQEKSLKRQERDERTLVVAKWGPITVLDARARAAKDENNRREAQEEENCRIRKKEVRIEVGFLRFAQTMMRVGGEALAVIWLTKGDRQVQLRDDGWMGRRYKSLRRTLLGRGPSDRQQRRNPTSIRTSFFLILQFSSS
ncbi:hypothetical protein E4U37_007597 [Claviceps purpurea]|nr:hypothetical protein E4U37_007597 [Claviceps purpurea]